MTKTTLVYFATQKDGTRGTLRGLIAIIPFLFVFTLGAFLCKRSKATVATRIWTVSLLSLVLCSAVAVQLPESYKEAGQYGALVGFVVSTVYVCIKAFIDGGVSLGVGDIIFIPTMIILVLLVSMFTMWLSNRFHLYG